MDLLFVDYLVTLCQLQRYFVHNRGINATNENTSIFLN